MWYFDDYERSKLSVHAAAYVKKLEDELHAIKYEVMGGEDVPGSASAATIEDVKQEMERLRAIERRCRK